MRPTMADVAEHAGVSTSTVSLVLNDRPGVSSEVRYAVLQAVEKLGYRLPERRPLKRLSETKTITVVHCASRHTVSPYSVSGLSASYVSGIQEFCQNENINWALIANYQEGDETHLAAHVLGGDRLDVDGLILIEIVSRESRLLQQAIQSHIPAVVISRDWPDLPVSTVGQDHCQQATLALDHLIGLGHRKIAFLGREGERGYDWFKIRLACYQKTMIGLGEWDDALIAVGASSTEAIKELMARRPDVTAIFAINDGNAISAMRGLRSIDIQVPAQVSVIGLDNSLPSPEGFPPLTTVAFPHYEVGRMAAELLLRQINDDQQFYSKVFLRSYLVERASCAPPCLGSA